MKKWMKKISSTVKVINISQHKVQNPVRFIDAALKYFLPSEIQGQEAIQGSQSKPSNIGFDVYLGSFFCWITVLCLHFNHLTQTANLKWKKIDDIVQELPIVIFKMLKHRCPCSFEQVKFWVWPLNFLILNGKKKCMEESRWSCQA